MSSRDQILNAIRQNRPAPAVLPEMPVFNREQDITGNFMQTLQQIGGTCSVVADHAAIARFRKAQQQKVIRVVNTVPEIGDYNCDAYKHADANELEAVHTVFVKGTVGVAENGAVWVREQDMVNRLFPFICRHLVIILEQKNIVADMHEAYRRISINENGYGAFIAGPSKTADIEQSLVIGAHGPLSMEVFIIS